MRKELRLDRKRRWRHASYSVSLEVKDVVADEDSRVLELLKVLGGLGSGAALVSTLLTPPRLVVEG